MEYLEKGDLTNYLKTPLPVLEAKQIAVQILEGLYHMHDQGFTHRDLKPAVSNPWL
jgi:calcium/calmodulin-dependent protein kinase I